MYSDALSGMGFEPVISENGEDAFARACVADVVLPGISGVEPTRKRREDDRTKHAAIIVLTGRTFGSDQEQASEAGCDRFLLKPCLPDVLADEIRQLLLVRGFRAAAFGLSRSYRALRKLGEQPLEHAFEAIQRFAEPRRICMRDLTAELAEPGVEHLAQEGNILLQ